MEPGRAAAETDAPIAALAVVLVAIAGVMWFLNSPAPVEIAEAEMVGDDLTAIVNSCGGDLTMDVYEDDGLVLVRALDHRFRLRLWGNDCQDGLTIPLSVPLGDRTLVDDTTSQQINVIVRDS